MTLKNHSLFSEKWCTGCYTSYHFYISFNDYLVIYTGIVCICFQLTTCLNLHVDSLQKCDSFPNILQQENISKGQSKLAMICIYSILPPPYTGKYSPTRCGLTTWNLLICCQAVADTSFQNELPQSNFQRFKHNRHYLYLIIVWDISMFSKFMWHSLLKG